MKSISKRFALILFLGIVVSVSADDYVDDVYFSSDMAAAQASGKLQPYFNKKAMQEIIFLEDTLPVTAYPDTVRAVIRR